MLRSAFLPAALTGLRMALGPVVIGLAWLGPHPAAFAACLIVAFLSDVLDGILARRFGVATAGLRRLDSIADTIFYLCALAAIWKLQPSVIRQNAGLLSALLALELARYGFDAWKFGREASYHMWSSKLWGIALFAGFFSVLVFTDGGMFVTTAIIIGILADIEGLLISLALSTWHYDVPSILRALRIRAREHRD